MEDEYMDEFESYYYKYCDICGSNYHIEDGCDCIESRQDDEGD